MRYKDLTVGMRVVVTTASPYKENFNVVGAVGTVIRIPPPTAYTSPKVDFGSEHGEHIICPTRLSLYVDRQPKTDPGCLKSITVDEATMLSVISNLASEILGSKVEVKSIQPDRSDYQRTVGMVEPNFESWELILK